MTQELEELDYSGEGLYPGGEGLTLGKKAHRFWHPRWKRHKYGGSCPECSATAHAPISQHRHTRWHAEVHAAFNRIAAERDALRAELEDCRDRVADLEAQMTFAAQLLGSPLIEKLDEMRAQIRQEGAEDDDE
jgi:hypothetical protein